VLITSSTRFQTLVLPSYDVLDSTLGVTVTCYPCLLETEGRFTQGWRHCRTFGESVGGISEMDSSDWSSGIRYRTFVTRPDTEFKCGVDIKVCWLTIWHRFGPVR